jgi:hypothetical protein
MPQNECSHENGKISGKLAYGNTPQPRKQFHYGPRHPLEKGAFVHAFSFNEMKLTKFPEIPKNIILKILSIL